MDTVKVASELDPALQNSLRQLIAEFAITGIFYHPKKTACHSSLLF